MVKSVLMDEVIHVKLYISEMIREINQRKFTSKIRINNVSWNYRTLLQGRIWLSYSLLKNIYP